MPATQSLIPIIGALHFDDLTGIFHCKITFEVKSLLGNFHREVKIDAGTLADALLQIASVLSGQGLDPDSYTLAFALGDMAALGTSLATLEGPTTVPEAFPDVTDVPTEPDAPFDTWNGERGMPDGFTDWGVPE